MKREIEELAGRIKQLEADKDVSNAGVVKVNSGDVSVIAVLFILAGLYIIFVHNGTLIYI